MLTPGGMEAMSPLDSGLLISVKWRVKVFGNARGANGIRANAERGRRNAERGGEGNIDRRTLNIEGEATSEGFGASGQMMGLLKIKNGF